MSHFAAAIIPAAGSGTRMLSETPKQFLSLAGKPILIHTVTAFTQCQKISQIIIVVPEEQVEQSYNLLSTYQLDSEHITLVAGGLRRQDSVFAGLKAVHHDIDIVLVHDGARPLVTPELISRCYHETIEFGAAIAAIPARDTLKKAGPDCFVSKTISRDGLWHAQTPQGVRKELLLAGYERLGGEEVTDESSILEQAGIPVKLVTGSETNFKITCPEDLERAEKIMRIAESTIRIGHGFDVHRFQEGRKLILGGVVITHPYGLAGHSDADVLTHALCDAVLGALGAGDIGSHFPDDDEAFKDISSLLLLERVISLATAQNLYLINADITVICQAPKLAPYIKEMKEKLATACQLTSEHINIKATTTEKLGYTGREEGISCHAVVLLKDY